jgi:hypothetical protein
LGKQKAELQLSHQQAVNAILTEKINTTPTFMDSMRQRYQEMNEIELLQSNFKLAGALNQRNEDAKLKVFDLMVEQGIEVAKNRHRRNEALMDEDLNAHLTGDVYEALSFLSPPNAKKSVN